MEGHKVVSLPVVLKGSENYLLWSRTAKAVLCGRKLWGHIENSEPPHVEATEEGLEVVAADSDGWYNEDQSVLSILQGSVSLSVLEAYSYCEGAKELWDTLRNVFGNVSNLTRVFEVKRALNNLSQGDMEFNAFFGKFRSLWAELEMLRPATLDAAALNERREQDKVFALLMVLNPVYNDLVKHLLRADKLPNLDEVCSQIQKEQGAVGLFGAKGSELVLANKSEAVEVNQTEAAANKAFGEREVWICEHCKKKGHLKNKCWILHPHLKQNRSSRDQRRPRANHAQTEEEAGPSNREKEGSALRASAEYVKKSDLDALIKALKESGRTVTPFSFHALHTTDDHIALTNDKPLIALHTIDNHAASNALKNGKPLIVDSGASHHMISDLSLISNLKPALGNVTIANGEKVRIEGIGDLKLFDKESKAFFMPSFTSNLLSIKKATTDLDCYAIFSPNEVFFQDIKSSKLLGQGTTRNGLYVLEDTKPLSSNALVVSSVNDNKSDLWHARLGHPHNKALSLVFPDVKFDNNGCEACILGKHCKTVFPKSSSSIYESCFDLIHSDVWTSPCLSRDSHKYFVTFIDEKSKYT
jgi:hypothetical protein